MLMGSPKGGRGLWELRGDVWIWGGGLGGLYRVVISPLGSTLGGGGVCRGPYGGLGGSLTSAPPPPPSGPPPPCCGGSAGAAGPGAEWGRPQWVGTAGPIWIL